MNIQLTKVSFLLTVLVGLAATLPGATPSPMTEPAPGVYLLEAEDFAQLGDWRVDTQFTHKMGSAYLICPGADKPTQNPAKTTVALPKAGTWQVWARTKDWLPEFSPGKFALEVNGQRGALLGAAKRGWGWEKVGAWDLPAGTVDLTLRDLSGAYARCDAILFTQDGSYVPSDKRDLVPANVADGGTYDVVIVGAGPGGMGAALGAARNGARVALVFDRPIPGGNASEECGIGFDGASLGHRNARESGVVEEIRLLKASGETTYTKAFHKMAAQSSNLSLFKNERVLQVEKNGTQISAVLSRNTLTGKWTRWSGRIFVDSTGDGWLGFFAGARTLYGREAGHEYGEEWIAPKVADKLTMSGTLSTGISRPTNQVQPYETPVWAQVLPKGFDRKIPGVGRPWWLEAPGRIDDVADPEAARDHLIRICFAYWGYVRNEWPERHKHGVETRAFTPPSIFNGRREGMRIVGDYILTANDCNAGRVFPDAVSYGGWSLDTHDPLGMDNPHGDGWWHPHKGVPIYTVPFRSLYSADVPNLLMGSRCESITHIALGSMRVQGTQMAAGQAVGTAAALCIRHNVMPRELGQTRIQELQQTLLKDDQYIPGLVNADPNDLARTATVTATSGDAVAVKAFGKTDPEIRRKRDDAHDLNMARATRFARGAADRLEGVDLLLKSARTTDLPITIQIVGTDDAKDTPDQGVVLGTLQGTVPAKRTAFVACRPAAPIALGKKFLWLIVPEAKSVAWLLRGAMMDDLGMRSWKSAKDGWQNVPGQQYAFVTTPQQRILLDAKPAYVIDGTARPIGTCVHGWVSDPEADLPQTITLTFPKPTSAREVRLVFDSDLTPLRAAPHPKQLVKAYTVEGCVDGTWKTLAAETDNVLRHRIHAFAPATLSALRVTVTKTWGDPSARIFEIRVY